MQLGYENLVIEVTRRCNMRCAHCLRGDAENLDMTEEIVDKFLGTATYIENITFSGGEPTLNLDIIRHVLEYVKARNISVHGFYVVTNGQVVTDEFLALMVQWYAYCLDSYGDEEYCGVALSKDDFHEQIDPHNVDLLSALSFFRPKDKDTDFTQRTMINDGRAKDISPYDYMKRDIDQETLEIEDYGEGLYVRSTVYLSCTGDIINGCDYSYDTMPDYKLGNVSDLPAYERVLEKAAEDAA